MYGSTNLNANLRVLVSRRICNYHLTLKFDDALWRTCIRIDDFGAPSLTETEMSIKEMDKVEYVGKLASYTAVLWGESGGATLNTAA